MFEKDGKKFNCCESVLLQVNEVHKLNGFGPEVMKTASNMGGGVAGCGSICGAVSGGAMAFGLLMGTSGDESPDDYTALRERMRHYTQILIDAFEEKWGNINCYDLLGVNTRTEKGKRIHEENKAKGIYYCNDFVDWTAEKCLEIINENSL
ncbi:MAG: C-GCAxxG-C-C family protein [Candidatus Bathyarchaeota archaeon]|nr:C-GCAxxG-C-C family protein [Candidatus Bathyarchaeota archaeon]